MEQVLKGRRMSESFKVGQRVKIVSKDVQGVVMFFGPTHFAMGKWLGVHLDEPKGKNNGSVGGHLYFQCEDNYGMFVRPSQALPIDEHGKPIDQKDSYEESRLKRPTTIGTKPKPTTIRRKTSPTKHPTSLSASSSRLSLASSRQSLAGSRQSLSGSRQSLVDSRSYMASPVIEKSAENESPTQIPKRASFVETGFVETLKPQFTPGQAITSAPPASVEEKWNNLQYQQELENRNQQIKDLTEKLETLKIRRQDDKEKMKDYDKLKIQLDQLLEFKTKIMESHTQLQRDLQRAKQDAKEAIESKDNHGDELSELSEAVEMATLDKEMAEEKAEALQFELDMYKDKLEDVTLELEILKTELQQRAGGTTEGDMSTYEVKQLQQQNQRLRETLIKLRDLSAHDKHEYQKLLKDMDQKKSEVAELGRTKEKLSTRVEDLEQQISDLQEQVDAALGAEEMVVLLGEQKLTLEEKVAKLTEEVGELEALQDMNDQIVESNVELEQELREELDMAHASTREALRDRDAAFEMIADRESTIGKFRELVQKLQEQSLDLKQRLETESNKPVSALPEILDFKKMFTDSKAHTKAIDLELRRLDVQQLQQHIKYLTAFMPDTFINRGGDHDAILVLLLIPRMLYKSDILLGQIKDKFPAVDKIDRTSIFKNHTLEQYAYRCRLTFLICSLQAVLNQYMHTLQNCKPETLLKVGSAYPEILGQEKVIDGFVELIKRDQLDENIPTEALEKCFGYFNTMYPHLLGIENKQNHTQLILNNIKALNAACDGINNDAFIIRSIIDGANVGDIGLLSQHIISTIDMLYQQLKLVKRRLPPDTSVSNLGLNKEISENLYHCCQHATKIMKTLQDIVKTAVQTIVKGGDTEKGLTPDAIKDIAINASDKIYEQDDLGPVQSIKNSLSFIITQITQLAQFLQDNEYEITTAYKKEEKVAPPIHLRAEVVRKELEQTKTLTNKLENKETDIKELCKALKEKQEQLSEMTIRKELAEKKLGNVNKDYELTIEKLQRKLEEAHNNFKKKEKEFEETLDHLQTDIDSLENEKGEMKEKLKLLSKKALSEGLSKNLPSTFVLDSLNESLPGSVRDSPMLLQEIENLRKLFNLEREQRLKLETEKMRKQLNNLSPLPTFRKTKDDLLDNLYKEGIALKQEILFTLAKPKFPPVYNAKPGQGLTVWQKHFAEEANKILALKSKSEGFQSKVAKEIIKRKYGGHIETDFTIFPTVEMKKALNESKSMNVGYVKFPEQCLSENDKPGIANVEFDLAGIQKLLSALSTLI